MMRYTPFASLKAAIAAAKRLATRTGKPVTVLTSPGAVRRTMPTLRIPRESMADVVHHRKNPRRRPYPRKLASKLIRQELRTRRPRKQAIAIGIARARRIAAAAKAKAAAAARKLRRKNPGGWKVEKRRATRGGRFYGTRTLVTSPTGKTIAFMGSIPKRQAIAQAQRAGVKNPTVAQLQQADDRYERAKRGGSRIRVWKAGGIYDALQRRKRVAGIPTPKMDIWTIGPPRKKNPEWLTGSEPHDVAGIGSVQRFRDARGKLRGERFGNKLLVHNPKRGPLTPYERHRIATLISDAAEKKALDLWVRTKGSSFHPPDHGDVVQRAYDKAYAEAEIHRHLLQPKRRNPTGFPFSGNLYPEEGEALGKYRPVVRDRRGRKTRPRFPLEEDMTSIAEMHEAIASSAAGGRKSQAKKRKAKKPKKRRRPRRR